MKKLLLLSISLILIAGCSNGISPQEKRNKFDACVIRYIQEHIKKFPKSLIEALIEKDLFIYESLERIANNSCVKLLD